MSRACHHATCLASHIPVPRCRSGASVGRVSADLHLPGTSGFRRLNLAMVLAGLAAFGILYATQPVLPLIGATYGVGRAEPA